MNCGAKIVLFGKKNKKNDQIFSKILPFLFKYVSLHPENYKTMKKYCQILVMSALTWGTITQAVAQELDRAAVEHELAITAYNYAVGCEERGNYDEALVGLSHIPTGQLTQQQQAWADSLRTKCEAMAGHPMPSDEVALTESEQLAIDDQSLAFMEGIKSYKAGHFAIARQQFSEVIEMGIGPRPQVRTEAMFWRGQCQYQLEQWEACCQDLILFNDTKDQDTDPLCDVKAYYTMGYARMKQQKWHHARLNFERYLDREKDTASDLCAQGKSRYQECKQLEAGTTKQYQRPLKMTRIDPTAGEAVNIELLQMKQSTQMLREKDATARARVDWKDWHAPFIEE